jgi:hypothetical protein
MDHAEAARTAAVEKYLLGEMPESQREAFEEHFFSCPECADRVRLAMAFRANARSALKVAGNMADIAPEPRRTWWDRLGERMPVWEWSGGRFRPSFAAVAAVAVTLLAGYQNLVVIPRLRQQSGGGSVFTVLSAAQVSEVRAATDRSFSRQAGQISLFVPHEWDEFYSSYTCELERRPGAKVLFSAGIGPVAGDFAVVVRTSALDPAKYVLNVYGVRADGQRKAVARFPVTLTN